MELIPYKVFFSFLCGEEKERKRKLGDFFPIFLKKKEKNQFLMKVFERMPLCHFYWFWQNFILGG